MHFFDVDNGLAAAITSANGEAIYKTTDGGESWVPVPQPGKREANAGPTVINDLYFLDRQTGFAAGNKVAWKTTDGGDSWESLSEVPPVNLQKVYFYGAAKGIMVGDGGKVYTTSNLGGATRPIANFSLPAAAFCPNTPYTFQNKGPASNTYKWYVNGTLAATSYNLTTTFEAGQPYDIKLVSERNGLTDYATEHLQSEQQATLRQFSLAYYDPEQLYCKPAPVQVVLYSVDPFGVRYQLWAEGKLLEETKSNNYSELRFAPVQLDKTTTYTIKAIKETPCQTLTQEATITFRLAPQPNLALEVEESESIFCPADDSKLSLIVKNSEPGFMYGIKANNWDTSFAEFEGNGGDLIIPTPYTGGGVPGRVQEIPVNVRCEACRKSGGSSTNFTLLDKGILRTSDFRLQVKLKSNHLYVDEPVEVTNMSVADKYTWTVTDGASHTTYHTPQLPRLAFATPGIKTIVLAISSLGKCADSTRMDVVVARPAPVASLGVCAAEQTSASNSPATPYSYVYDRVVVNHLDKDGFEYTAGSMSGRFVLRKYDGTGKLIWVKSHEGGGYNGISVGTAITSDKEGNVYVAGHYTTDNFALGTVSFPAKGPVRQVSFIIKLDRIGQTLWAIRVATPYPKSGSSNVNYITDLALDEEQHVYAVFKASSDVLLTFPDGSVQAGVAATYMVLPTFLLKTDGDGHNLGTTLLLEKAVAHDANNLTYTYSSSPDYLTSPQIEIDNHNNMYVVGSRSTVPGEPFSIAGYPLAEQRELLQQFPEGGIQGYVAILNLKSGKVEKAFNTFFQEAKSYPLATARHPAFSVPFAITPGGIVVGYNWDAAFLDKTDYHTYTTAKKLVTGGVTFEGNFSGSLAAAYDLNGNNVWTATSHGTFINSLYYSASQAKLYAYAQLDSLSISCSAGGADYGGVAANKGKSEAILVYSGAGKLEGVWQPEGQPFGSVPFAIAAGACGSVYTVSGLLEKYESSVLPVIGSKLQFRTIALGAACAGGASATVPFTHRQVCKGEAVQLQVNGAGDLKFSWSPAAGLDDPASAAPVATPAASTTYTATAQTADGCVVKREVRIDVDEPLVVPDSFVAQTKAYSTSVDFQLPTEGAGAGYTYTWDFGDGTTASSNLAVFTHFYPAIGTYTACLTVGNACAQKKICQQVTVPCLPPAAELKFVQQGLQVSFQMANAQQVASWEWDFGDGTTGSAQNPAHTYAPGTYEVKLKISSGCVEQILSKTLTVNCPPLNASIQTQVNRQEVTFQAVGVAQENILKWTFSDGSSTTDKAPVHTFSGVGKYTATLWLQQQQCGPATVTADVAITCGTLSAAGFGMAVAQTKVSFAPPAGAAAVSYLWDFGDGDKSTDASPEHTYHLAGEYHVCLTMTDACGTASFCQQVDISCEVPASSDFTYTVGKGNSLLISFKADAAATAARFSWTFGDGATSQEAAPQHAYASTGQYEVCLVTSTDCRVDSVCKDVSFPTGIIDDIENKLLRVYPNPVADALYLEMDPAFASRVSSLVVYDALGRSVFAKVGGASAMRLLDTRSLSRGTYYIRLKTQDGNFILKKFVVEH
ncbi:PKD domain-containing protein [Pontibacter chitinilyticus]|uniref:T9SS type A sorting domain-containing protein n=1 Tax=Pontibacter chitinilyticus TaxID=2674989 RepID=UPI00321A334C